MAKIKVDATGQDPKESTGRGNREEVPVGVYLVKVTQCNATKPENMAQRLEVKAEIQTGGKADTRYWPLRDWINLESEASLWKLDQFLQAFKILTEKKRTAEFDDASIVGKLAAVRVYHESFTPAGSTTPQQRAKIGEWMDRAAIKAAKDEPVADTSTDDEISLGMHGDAADNGDDDSIAYLMDLAEPLGIDPEEIDTWAEVAQLIEEKQGESEEKTDESDDSEDVDLDALAEAADNGDDDAIATLYDMASSHEIDPDEIDTWVEVVAEIRAVEEGGEGDGADATDWSTYGVVDLKKACKERDLPSTGTKDELIARLSEFDGADPFTE